MAPDPGVLGLALAGRRTLSFAERTLWARLWMPRFRYRAEPARVDAGWTVFETRGTAEIPLRLLRARIRTPSGKEARRLDQTPHHPFIRSVHQGRETAGSRLPYETYIRTYEPDVDPAGRLQQVRRLASELARDPSRLEREPSICVVPPGIPLTGRLVFEIMDGVHRSVAAKVLGFDRLRVRVV